MNKLYVLIFFIFLLNKTVASPLTCIGYYNRNNSHPIAKAYSKKYNLDFVKSLRVEIDSHIRSVELDQSGGDEKFKMLESLGFNFPDNSYSIPNHTQIIENYIKIMTKKNRDPKKTILPALVLYREVNSKIEYKLITPGVDAWPADNDYKILYSSKKFNIPSSFILEALKNKRFPLMDGIHDVFHLIGFLNHPDYMESLYETSLKIDKTMTSNLKKRMFFLIELLEIGNVKKQSLLKQVLYAPTRVKKQTYEDYKSVFLSLSESDLKEQSKQIIKKFESLMVDYGGIVTASWEKSDFDSTLKRNFKAQDNRTFSLRVAFSDLEFSVIKSDDEVVSYDSPFGFLPRVLNNLLVLKRMSKNNFLNIVEQDDFLRDIFINDSKLVDDYQQILTTKIANTLAKIEYLVFQSSKIPANEWVHDLFVQDINPSSRSVHLIQEVYGHSGLGSIMQ